SAVYGVDGGAQCWLVDDTDTSPVKDADIGAARRYHQLDNGDSLHQFCIKLRHPVMSEFDFWRVEQALARAAAPTKVSAQLG
ncbi:MAG: hypothetical protein AAFO87_13040, partial [Cyanobacteria bacterium J06607_6]